MSYPGSLRELSSVWVYNVVQFFPSLLTWKSQLRRADLHGNEGKSTKTIVQKLRNNLKVNPFLGTRLLLLARLSVSFSRVWQCRHFGSHPPFAVHWSLKGGIVMNVNFICNLHMELYHN